MWFTHLRFVFYFRFRALQKRCFLQLFFIWWNVWRKRFDSPRVCLKMLARCVVQLQTIWRLLWLPHKIRQEWWLWIVESQWMDFVPHQKWTLSEHFEKHVAQSRGKNSREDIALTSSLSITWKLFLFLKVNLIVFCKDLVQRQPMFYTLKVH